MFRFCRWVLVLAALAAAPVVTLPAQSLLERADVFASARFHDPLAVSMSSAEIDMLIDEGQLRLIHVEQDPWDPGRRFEYQVLHVGGVPVRGVSITRAVRDGGPDLVIGSLPSLVGDLPRLEAEVAAASASGWYGWRSACGAVASEEGVSLVDVEGLSPDFALPLLVYRPLAAVPAAAWQCYLGDGAAWFVSAVGAPVVLGVEDMVVRQDGRQAVGSGVGLNGEVKNVFTTRDSSGFLARDTVRRPGIVLLDASFNGDRLRWFSRETCRGCPAAVHRP